MEPKSPYESVVPFPGVLVGVVILRFDIVCPAPSKIPLNEFVFVPIGVHALSSKSISVAS